MYTRDSYAIEAERFAALPATTEIKLRAGRRAGGRAETTVGGRGGEDHRFRPSPSKRLVRMR
jgi:hypothetical protein